MTHLKEQAERGDASSQSTLGRTYAYGTGVAKDWQEAEKWYRKCAENGFADCHAGIGGLYRYGGPNLKQDWQEAFFWYSLAANSKVHDPQYPADRDEVSKHLTAEQVAAVNNRVAEWEKAHPAPASKP
jgi:TPR repeat protein